MPHAEFSSLSPHRGPGLIWPMIVGAAIFAVGCVGGTIVGWGLGQASWLGLGPTAMFGGGAFDSAADVYIDVERPAVVKVGEPFDLLVTVSDLRGEPRTIEDLDIEGALCDLFKRDAISPEPQITNESYGYHEHKFGRPLAANGSIEFTITLTPQQAGRFESTITVYTEDYDSEEYFLRLDVEQ